MNTIVRKKTILTAMLGNIFEAYDITCFLFLLPFITQTFFPADKIEENILKTLSVFFLGFIVRPIGGMVFGVMADLYGRKRVLILSVLIASFSTACIVGVPGYAQWGSLAGFMLVCCRIGQSFALGGEYVTSVAFIIEHVPKSERGYYGSWAAFGANLGVFMAALVCMVVSLAIEKRGYPVWIWRLPFLISLLGIVVSFWIRKNVPEALEFVLENAVTTTRTMKSLLKEANRFFVSDKPRMAIIMVLTCLGASSYYIVFASISFHGSVQVSHVYRLFSTMLSVGLLAGLAPFSGKLSDKIGRESMLLWCCFLFLVLSVPYFYLTTYCDLRWMLLMQSVMAFPAAGFYSIILTYIAEMIPVQVRCSVGGFFYSVFAGVFGGAAPLVASLLVRVSHNPMAPGYYLMAIAFLCILSLYLYGRKFEVEFIQEESQ